MPGIKVRDNEGFDSAIRRFKRVVEKSGILSEMRRREFHETPSMKRKRATAAAVKRFRKKVMRAVTDSGPSEMNQEKPEAIQNLFTLMDIVSTPDTVAHFDELYNKCEIRYGDLKKQLAESNKNSVQMKKLLKMSDLMLSTPQGREQIWELGKKNIATSTDPAMAAIREGLLKIGVVSLSSGGDELDLKVRMRILTSDIEFYS